MHVVLVSGLHTHAIGGGSTALTMMYISSTRFSLPSLALGTGSGSIPSSEMSLLGSGLCVFKSNSLFRFGLDRFRSVIRALARPEAATSFPLGIDTGLHALNQRKVFEPLLFGAVGAVHFGHDDPLLGAAPTAIPLVRLHRFPFRSFLPVARQSRLWHIHNSG